MVRLVIPLLRAETANCRALGSRNTELLGIYANHMPARMLELVCMCLYLSHMAHATKQLQGHKQKSASHMTLASRNAAEITSDAELMHAHIHTLTNTSTRARQFPRKYKHTHTHTLHVHFAPYLWMQVLLLVKLC